MKSSIKFKKPTSRRHPDPLASKEVKDSEEYGIRMAEEIEYEWFRVPAEGNSSPYFDQRSKFDNLRRYSRGEQSTDLYKKLISSGTDGEAYTNYDFRPIQILPKFIKLIVNQMLERLYDIDAKAVDSTSQGLRDAYKSILEKNMVAKPMLQDAKELLNLDLTPGGIGEIPDSPEELDLQMRLKYKPSIEIAIQQALRYTLELNEYDEIQRKLLKDLVEIGVSFIKHRLDPVKGIVVDYADPADMVWSYPTSSNFKDVYYYGIVKRITLSELQRLAGKEFSDDEIRGFVNVSNEWAGYQRISNEFWYRGQDLQSYMVDIIDFTYKTTVRKKFKKKYKEDGSYSLTEKDKDFIKTDKQLQKEKEQGFPDFDILEDVQEVWYEGSKVLGTDRIFNYGPCEEMTRPDAYISTGVKSKYIGYAPELYQGRIQSLVDRVILTVDQLQQIQIKIQQFIAKAKPNGIFIDVDGLEEVDLGGGNSFTPLEMIKFYDDTGNLIGTSKLADGGYNSGQMPIKELNNGQIAGLEQLMNAYNFHLNLFRESIGIGAGADATLPDPRTAVKVQEQVNIRSNVATRYVLEGQLKMTQYLCDGISLMLKAVLKHPRLKKAYINSIGKFDVDILNSFKDLHLHDFGIYVKLKPDGEAKAMLEQNIQAEIATGGISTSDGIDIRNISDLDLANEMLKLRKAKREEKMHQRELEKIKQQSEGNAQAAQAAEQAKMQSAQFLASIKEREITMEYNAKKELMTHEGKEKERLMMLEYALMKNKDVAVASVKGETDMKKEDRKDSRDAKAKSMESELNVQRKSENPKPVKFNSEFGSITGDLGM